MSNRRYYLPQLDNNFVIICMVPLDGACLRSQCYPMILLLTAVTYITIPALYYSYFPMPALKNNIWPEDVEPFGLVMYHSAWLANNVQSSDPAPR